MIKKSIYILILSISAVLTIAIIVTAKNVGDAPKEPSPTFEISTTATSFVEVETTEESGDYQVIINLSNEEITAEPIIEIKPTTTALISTLVTPEPTQQFIPTSTPKPTNTPKPTSTTAPTAVPTNTPAPTASPTTAPDYTLNQDSHFISEVLRGVNDVRDIDEINHVYLCDELMELAEQHAIAMALKDEYSFHSDYFFVESVRSGCYINGFMEGVGAAGHATQLGMDEEVTRIGVGSAVSKTGRVFTCVLGGSDGW